MPGYYKSSGCENSIHLQRSNYIIEKRSKMSFKVGFCFVVLALLLVSALGKQDPELKQCEHQCRVQQQYDKEQREKCVQRCEEYHREKQRREEGGGSGSEEEYWNRQSPIEKLRECVKGCEQEHGEQREVCQRRCQKEYEREKEQYEGHGNDESVDPQKEYEQCSKQCRRQSEGDDRSARERCERRCEERRRELEREQEEERGRGRDEKYEGTEREEEEETKKYQGENPYVFKDQHFMTGMQTQHGRVRILQKFTDRSKLLRGIENYRVAVLEADPQTFVVPNHWDAEALIFVAKGRGTVSLLRQGRRESFNINQGDILRIKAGTTAYLINRDNNERLVLAKLLQPVSTPGQFEVFFGAGGENPASFYRVFSNEILEAAFNTRRDRLQKLFGQQKQGVILKASEEQIRAMSHHEEGGIWPFGGETKGTFNIYQQRPTHSNQHGQLYEVDSSHYRQLQDLDIAVSLVNITRGSMTALYYNSKATKICIGVDGKGYFEMACPHLSQSQGRHQGGSQWEGPDSRRESRGGPTYQKVSSPLEGGTVAVIPAGHPFVAVASNNQNLQLICFEVNAHNNEKVPLAGRRNVMNQLEKEARELSFGVPAREVEEIFRSQQEEFFFRGPRQQHQGRSEA